MTDIGEEDTGNKLRRDRYRLKRTDIGEEDTGNMWRRDRNRLKKTDLGEEIQDIGGGEIYNG